MAEIKTDHHAWEHISIKHDGATGGVSITLTDKETWNQIVNENIYFLREDDTKWLIKALKKGLMERHADIVSVVRCRDCIRYGEPTCLMAYDGKEWTAEDGFCHFGEKKQNVRA